MSVLLVSHHVISESVVPIGTLLFREEYGIVEPEELPSVDPLVLLHDVVEPVREGVPPVQ